MSSFVESILIANTYSLIHAAEIESCQDEEDVPKKQEKKKTKKSPTPVTEEINEKWITEHARQVCLLLCCSCVNIFWVSQKKYPLFKNHTGLPMQPICEC